MSGWWRQAGIRKERQGKGKGVSGAAKQVAIREMDKEKTVEEKERKKLI